MASPERRPRSRTSPTVYLALEVLEQNVGNAAGLEEELSRFHRRYFKGQPLVALVPSKCRFA